MKPAFRIILALSFSLMACGHSKPELFLDQTTTALECGSSNARDCAPAGGADAGPPRPELDECYGDGDGEYGEVCERRHGVPEDGRHGDDDGYGGHGGHDGPDAGAAGGDPTCAEDDYAESSDGGYHDDEDHDEDRDEDRSGSNSGRH